MKNWKKVAILGCSISVGAFISACERSQSDHYRSKSIFTKTDSLRANYLSFQDSIVFYINSMSSEYKNRKAAMLKLTEELEQYEFSDSNELNNLKEKIKKIKDNGLNSQQLAKEEWVINYDKTFDSLQTELMNVVSQIKEKEKLKKMVETLQKSEAQLSKAKARYNRVAIECNHFIDKYNNLIKEITYKDSIGRCPVVALN